ncbi:MAG: EamA/RhaT family transporter [Pseudomonadota bacterium]
MIEASIGLALLCLIVSGLLDLVLKLYAAKQRSRGMLIFGIGCVWIALQLAYMGFTSAEPSFDRTTLTYGIVAAIFVTVSNILLVECMGHLPISMASTVYRLNTVPLVIIAFWFLHEDIGSLRVGGIVAGLVTVALLYEPVRTRVTNSPHYLAFTYLIILASIVRALYGVATKGGVNNGGDPNTMMLLAAVGWCIGGLAYAHFRERRVIITKDKLKFIPVAGCLVFSVVWLLTTALTMGDASVIVPIANMGFVAAFLFSLALRLELINPRKLSAIVSAAIAIALLTGSA